MKRDRLPCHIGFWIWGISLGCCGCFLAGTPRVSHGADVMIRIQSDGELFEGQPLSANGEVLSLLLRSGSLRKFDSDLIESFAASPTPFRPLTPAELRGHLMREFPGFEVTAAGRFLAVHEEGQGSEWAARFDELFRGFVHYFKARGVRLTEPQFPLAAIILPTRQEFNHFALAEGVKRPEAIVGYYSPKTNYIVMYDSRQTGKGDSWRQASETIIHEAAHQSAFNCGIHSRFSPTPQWVAEGLGTMFEARGVWDSRRYLSLPDRTGAQRLDGFRRYASRRREGTILELVCYDRLFEIDMEGAYAESWALTLYLAEKDPKNYAALLAKIASRPPGEEYSAPQRLADFTAIFGKNLSMLETRVLRFVDELK